MDKRLCDHLFISHSVDSKTHAKDRPKKIYKKWKRRWVVLSGNISPSKCCLDYCKKESDWLSKNQSEITRCQLTSFSVQKFTGCGENANHVIISLSSYAICLSFESSSKMDQWYGALERLLEFYDVTLQCPKHQGFKGAHVVQFSSPGPFKLEVEVGRKSCVGDGQFFFSCQRGMVLYWAIRNAMDLIVLHPGKSPVPSMSPAIRRVKTVSLMTTENVSTADCPGALIDPIIHRQRHTCIKRPIATPNLVSAQTQPSAYTSPVHHDSDQTHTYDVPSAKTIPKPNQTSNQHDDVISSEYTSLAHQDSAQTHTYDVPLGNTTLEQSPDQHDDVTSSEYTSLAHQDSVQTNTYDVPLDNTTLKQSPDQHDDVISSEHTLLAHQYGAQTNTYDDTVSV
ncbi:hypothetical protein EMCRGX_G031019 [Ephydatia muelleri]